MAEEKNNASRRFTLFELVVYVSAICVAFGVIHVLSIIDAAHPGPLISLIVGGFFAIGVLGALIGIPVALLVSGRRALAVGAVLGAVGLPTFWFLAEILIFKK